MVVITIINRFITYIARRLDLLVADADDDDDDALQGDAENGRYRKTSFTPFYTLYGYGPRSFATVNGRHTCCDMRMYRRIDR